MPLLGQYQMSSQYKPKALLSAIRMLAGEERQSDNRNRYADTIPYFEVYIDF